MRPLLYFDDMKEIRDGGFVEYSPPQNSCNFAQLHLTVLESCDADELARRLKDEATAWLERFPTIPIMASTFDVTGSLIDLSSVKPDDFLYAWTDDGQNQLTWDPKAFSSYTNAHPLDFDLRVTFPAVHCRTDAEVKQTANSHFAKVRRRNQILRWLFLIWVAVIPATWAIIEFLGPEWLGAIVFAYSIWKTFKEGRKALGYYRPSKAEEEKSEKQRKKDYYFYHCERNPSGFTRLMCENLDEDAKQRTLREAKQLSSR